MTTPTTTTPTLKPRRHYDGCYRVHFNASPQFFGQVKRHESGDWLAEVRYTATGELRRYAGLHSTLREAVADLAELDLMEAGRWTPTN